MKKIKSGWIAIPRLMIFLFCLGILTDSFCFTKSREKNSSRKRSSSKRYGNKASVGRRVQLQQSRKTSLLDSSQVRRLQKRQARRLKKINGYKVRRWIGEMDSGMLGLCPLGKGPKSRSSRVRSVIDSENRDRGRIYRILAQEGSGSLKERKEREALLRKSFFTNLHKWDSPKTCYYQGGRWQEKPK